MRVDGAVLAGGASRRLGTDKALVRIEPGGPTLLELAVRALMTVVEAVAIVAPPRVGYATMGAELVLDRHPGFGPLGGIASALAWSSCDATIVISCDLPLLHPAIVRRLSETSVECNVVAPRIAGASRQGGGFVYQTLCARYGRGCLPAIERAIAAGQAQVIGFFDDVSVCPISEGEIRAIDPDLDSFLSVNTSEALELVRIKWKDRANGTEWT